MQDSPRLSLYVAVACLLWVMAGVLGAGSTQGADSGPKKIEAVDVNKASLPELIELPGIGETLARRIVEFREQNGAFRRVEDLMKIKGIGERSFEKLRPYVKVSKAE